MSALTVSRTIATPHARAAVVLLPSLGTSTRVWDAGVAALPLRIPVEISLVDLPGHGAAPPAEEVGMEQLVREGAAIVARAGRGLPVVIAGVSLGGALAMEIAAAEPRRVAAVATFANAARFGSPEGWDAIIDGVRAAGSAAFDPEGTRAGWFTPSFTGTTTGAAVADDFLADLVDVDAGSYLACCRALSGYDGSCAIAGFAASGLAVGGARDRAVPPERTREVAESARSMTYAELPGAHLALVENADHAAGLLGGLVHDAVRRNRIGAA